MQTFTFANQKGGVGKSTIAIHKAIYHAQRKDRVLFIDVDRQANSSKALRKRDDVKIAGPSVDLFGEDDLPAIDSMPGITLLGGTAALQDVESKDNRIVVQPRRHLAKVSERFDVCIFDTPPVLGKIMIGAFVASDYVLSPLDLSPFSIDGISQLLETVKGIANNRQLNPNLRFLGMIPNLVDTRAGIDKDTLVDLHKHFSKYLLNKAIIRRACYKEAAGTGEAVWEMKSSTAKKAAQDMTALLELIDDLVKQGVAA